MSPVTGVQVCAHRPPATPPYPPSELRPPSHQPLPLKRDRHIRPGALQAAGLPGAVGRHLQLELPSNLLAAGRADQRFGKDFEPFLRNLLAADAAVRLLGIHRFCGLECCLLAAIHEPTSGPCAPLQTSHDRKHWRKTSDSPTFFNQATSPPGSTHPHSSIRH